MSTIQDPRSNAVAHPKARRWARRNGRYRFTVEQFFQLDELGFFDDRHVELIDGVLYEMVSKPPHATAIELTSEALKKQFGAGWYVRQAQPFDMGRRSFLEPDLAVVIGSIRDYSEAHPTSSALIVEISDTTLRKDRTIKVHLYAQVGLADYWIVNLVDRQLEVHRNPVDDPARKGRFRYENVTIVPESGRMAPLAAPESPIAVADLLP